MSIGSTALSAIIAALPENVVELQYAGSNSDLAGTISSAFQSGMERVRAQTDEGLLDAASGNVRYLTSDEPTAWATETNGIPAISGQVVKIKFYGESSYVRFRVAKHGL